MKITLITTQNHNIGDDFVREGLKYLLRQHFKNTKLEFQNIHKHAPITSRYGFEGFRYHRLSSKLDTYLPKRWSKDRMREADLVIQSGAPVYWCHDIGGGHCHDTDWYGPLIKERFLKKHGGKFLNLAAGTCQRYHSTGDEFCDKCKDYIKELYNITAVTTLRDTLSKEILSKLNLDSPVIPCCSIFAGDAHGLKPETGEYVVLNYMEGGAHYTFGQPIDINKWKETFTRFYLNLRKKEKVVIACHNRKEVDETLALVPQADIFFEENDFLAYMKFYQKAKFGIVNRVHSAFLIGSFEKPSIVIGNDSRARMAEEIGLRHFFVNEVDYDTLSKSYLYLKNGAENFSGRFRLIKKKAYKDYLKILSTI